MNGKDILMAARLSEDEMCRYRRQLIMPDIGAAGQKRLKQASVMIAGVGGLGGLSALHMTAAGVGRLVITGPGSDCGIERPIHLPAGLCHDHSAIRR
ncbi:uncharacterized protein Dvar_25120 [Desulfosarcina variabilis str. Montpellier]